ncbi:YihY/virulence factor BrkB family protein [Shimia litoralis]|uniref:YihY/virulence factor BrkB family protein n=1 Tax=Shimia litoralis TaxID=420403 RepID=A0A4U7MVI2_9RHOB|nr:YihY/virulence factor BrkB family protein [Shimia litoralis]TKZ17150.1 YihY/virulence factor BrkB family protein [Shimia litoralis]
MIFWQALRDAARRFNTNGGLVLSSHIALSMMLAIFPFCLLALSVAGMLSSWGMSQPDADMGDLLEVVFGSWPDAIAAPIETEVRAVLEQSNKSTITFGALLTLLFASNGFEAVRLAISECYHEVDPRPLWKKRLLSLAFALGGAVFVTLAGLIGLVIPVYMRIVSEAAPKLHIAVVPNELVALVVTLIVSFLGVLACHKWLPGIKRPIRALLPGIILTFVLWYVIASVFEYYISNFSTYSVTYAGLAGVISALVFMYLMAAVFVFGAEYNACLGRLAKANKLDL